MVHEHSHIIVKNSSIHGSIGIGYIQIKIERTAAVLVLHLVHADPDVDTNSMHVDTN